MCVKFIPTTLHLRIELSFHLRFKCESFWWKPISISSRYADTHSLIHLQCCPGTKELRISSLHRNVCNRNSDLQIIFQPITKELCNQIVTGWKISRRSEFSLHWFSKGQLISKGILGFFNSPKKRTKNFCPSRLGKKLKFSSLFYGRIEDTKISFRN